MMQILAEILDFLSSVVPPESLVPLLLAVLIVGWLMWSARRKLRGRDQCRDEETAQREPPKPGAGTKENLRRDLESLIVELQDLSRKISAEIDTRFVKLEAAMQDADRRIAALNRLSRGLVEKTGDAPKGVEGADVRYAVIYELADEGFSPVEIARDLGKTPGEVELILNLRKQTESQSTESQD